MKALVAPTSLSLSRVLEATGGRSAASASDLAFSSVSIDSRTLEPGALFVAIRGERFDGHAFLAQARARGAASRGDDAPARAASKSGGSPTSETPAVGRSGAPHGDQSPAEAPPYDPHVYSRVYESVLRHRHVDVIALDTVLPTSSLSVYDFATPPSELAASITEADAIIREVERRYLDPDALDREIARWWAIT